MSDQCEWIFKSGPSKGERCLRPAGHRSTHLNKATQAAKYKVIRRWQASNPERQVAKVRASYIKRVAAGLESVTAAFAPAVFEVQGSDCALCQMPLKPGKSLHVDHFHGCERHAFASTSTACRWCVRGLVHASCNQVIAYFEREGTVPAGFTKAQLDEYVARRPLITADLLLKEFRKRS